MKDLELKLDLRRQVLKAAGFRRLRVLDLYAGDGEVWKALQQEFDVARYLPCDASATAGVAPSPPPLFVEAMTRERFNVIDADVEGEPWEIWQGIARRLRQPAAIFLTYQFPKDDQISPRARKIMGIPVSWRIPPARELEQFIAKFYLVPTVGDCRLVQIWKTSARKAIFYGFLAEPNTVANKRRTNG